ncbi:thioredoxin reductase [Rhypophila decipiens]
MYLSIALLILVNLVSLVSPVAIPNKRVTPKIDYDTIVVGGGPAGLAALSGLARVRRKALLIDSGEYRNGLTRNMHDVLGHDGITPAYFRHRARGQITTYKTISFTNGTVTKITPGRNPVSPGTSFFTVTADLNTTPGPTSKQLTTRKVILATGLIDVIPSTPGLAENWAKGIYWCPWCDGHEHADQLMGLLCDLNDAVGAFREIITLNSDVIAYVNGTDTPEYRALNDAEFPGWEKYLAEHNMKIENRTIISIKRVKDASEGHHDPSLPSTAEFDLFDIELANEIDGNDIREIHQRGVFFTSFPSKQRSNLGQETGVYMYSPGRLGVDQSMRTNIDGIYAAGDANSDNSTNVPHAMYSGKRAAVFLHQKLSQEDSVWEVTRLLGSKFVKKGTRFQKLDPRLIWRMMNGRSREDDILHAGDFDP